MNHPINAEQYCVSDFIKYEEVKHWSKFIGKEMIKSVSRFNCPKCGKTQQSEPKHGVQDECDFKCGLKWSSLGNALFVWGKIVAKNELYTENEIQKAIANEDYELAGKLKRERDSIANRLKKWINK